MTTMIDKPVEGVTTDVRPHPAGKTGAKLSLKEVAERAWKARMSPRLRAWATQQLAACGVSRGTRQQQAQCILDAFRKKVPFIADPVMGEFMETPNQTLCLDEGGLCFIGTDCDGASITLQAALMSIGIPTMTVGSSHREPYDVPTHVFLAFEDNKAPEGNEWVRMDGTTDLPVGKTVPHEREWWVEPGAEAKERGEGDFVGMSGTGKTSASCVSDFLYPTIR